MAMVVAMREDARDAAQPRRQVVEFRCDCVTIRTGRDLRDSELDKLIEFPSEEPLVVGDTRRNASFVEAQRALEMKNQQQVRRKAIKVAGIAARSRLEERRRADVLDQQHPRS